MWFSQRVRHPKHADRKVNSVDPDQTAPLGSTLFAQTCLSENLESFECFFVQYDKKKSCIHALLSLNILLFLGEKYKRLGIDLHKIFFLDSFDKVKIIRSLINSK